MELLGGVLLLGSFFALAIAWDFFTNKAKDKEDLPIVVLGFLFAAFLIVIAFFITPVWFGEGN